MDQDVTQVVAVPFKQKSGHYDAGPMQLATEWALDFIANQQAWQCLGLGLRFTYSEYLARLFDGQGLTTAKKLP
jgi:hypothetical protein